MVSPEKETEIKVPRNEVYFHHMSQVSGGRLLTAVRLFLPSCVAHTAALVSWL